MFGTQSFADGVAIGCRYEHLDPSHAGFGGVGRIGLVGVEVVRIVHGDAADVLPLIEQRFPDGFLRGMGCISGVGHMRMTAVDLQQLGTFGIVNIVGREGPIEIRMVDQRDTILRVHVFDGVNERRTHGGVFAAADGFLCAQTIHVHARALHRHGQLFPRDDDERLLFQRFERLRAGAGVVVGECDERKAVVAIPRVHITRMTIPVAPIAVGMNVSALKRRDVERRVEGSSRRNRGQRQVDGRGRCFGRRNGSRCTSTNDDGRDRYENDGPDRCADDPSRSDLLQERSLAVHITSVALLELGRRAP